MLLGKCFGFGNVSGLAGFITPGQQEHDVVSLTCEIDPVAWTDVPAQLRHTTTDAFDITPLTN